jgi:hypothetical protein
MKKFFTVALVASLLPVATFANVSDYARSAWDTTYNAGSYVCGQAKEAAVYTKSSAYNAGIYTKNAAVAHPYISIAAGTAATAALSALAINYFKPAWITNSSDFLFQKHPVTTGLVTVGTVAAVAASWFFWPNIKTAYHKIF